MNNIYEVIQELEWFFEMSESSIGLCSNLGAIINSLNNGGVNKSSRPDSMTDKRGESSERRGRIVTKLRQLSSEHQEYLYAAYTVRDYGRDLRNAFKHKSLGVTPYTFSGRMWFDEDSNNGDRNLWFAWLQWCILKSLESNANARTFQQKLDRIGYEAERLLDDAHRAYAAQD